MKKIIIPALIVLMMLTAACAKSDVPAGAEDAESAAKEQTESKKETEPAGEEEKSVSSLKMKINDEEVAVKWEDNESVRALMEMASEEPVTIEMSRYGGFEQVGALGTTIPSSDEEITTEPGDIMLYTSNNIVVFYGSNSWAYTKLGHIEGKSADELAEMLGAYNVTLTITF